jgi:hypothetical protein
LPNENSKLGTMKSPRPLLEGRGLFFCLAPSAVYLLAVYLPAVCLLADYLEKAYSLEIM